MFKLFWLPLDKKLLRNTTFNLNCLLPLWPWNRVKVVEMVSRSKANYTPLSCTAWQLPHLQRSRKSQPSSFCNAQMSLNWSLHWLTRLLFSHVKKKKKRYSFTQASTWHVSITFYTPTRHKLLVSTLSSSHWHWRHWSTYLQMACQHPVPLNHSAHYHAICPSTLCKPQTLKCSCCLRSSSIMSNECYTYTSLDDRF